MAETEREGVDAIIIIIRHKFMLETVKNAKNNIKHTKKGDI